MYLLERDQQIRTTIREAWDFIRTPQNLNRITPPDLEFEIVSNVPDRMYNGLIIEYLITIPFFGRQKWIAEIQHIREPFSFVDKQKQGPYKHWHHYHELIETENGVRIIDKVYYEMPLGILGRLLHFIIIRKTLERIFDFRAVKFEELLSR